jgi:hypothetical protein
VSIPYNYKSQLDLDDEPVSITYTVWILAIKAQLTRRALSKILSLSLVSVNPTISMPTRVTHSNQDVLHESYHRWHYAPKQKEYAAIPYQSTSYPKTQSWDFLVYREEGRFLQPLWFPEVACRLRVGLEVPWFWLRLSRKFVSHPTCAVKSVKTQGWKVLYIPGGRSILVAGTLRI